jgi:hypothetical protein
METTMTIEVQDERATGPLEIRQVANGYVVSPAQSWWRDNNRVKDPAEDHVFSTFASLCEYLEGHFTHRNRHVRCDSPSLGVASDFEINMNKLFGVDWGSPEGDMKTGVNVDDLGIFGASINKATLDQDQGARIERVPPAEFCADESEPVVYATGCDGIIEGFGMAPL